MFCTKCGTHLPDESLFCSSCGIKLAQVKISKTAIGKCLFEIERKSSIYGMAAKTRVYIDGNLVKELSSGESFSMELNNGKHNLFCDAILMDRTVSHEFVGEDNKISYSVSYPSAVQSFFSVGGRSLIINKIGETTVGTYR